MKYRHQGLRPAAAGALSVKRFSTACVLNETRERVSSGAAATDHRRMGATSLSASRDGRRRGHLDAWRIVGCVVPDEPISYPLTRRAGECGVGKQSKMPLHYRGSIFHR